MLSKNPQLLLATSVLLFAFIAGACSSPARGTQNPSVPPSVNWDDLSVYKADLVQSEEAVLASLGDASVYHLDLTVAPDFQSVSGNEQVRYTNQETVDLPFVYFRLFPNESGGKETVSTATVDLKAANFETASSSTAIKVMLAQPLKPGAAVTIQLDFIVIMPAGTDNNFGLLGYFNNILALDSFFPIIPVYDDKGWHIEITDPKGDKTYNDAAFFLAKINAPSSMSLVASGVEVSREVQGSNQVVTFADGPARDFYLVASNQFARLSKTIGETTINSYYLPGEQTGAQKALSVAHDAIMVYSNRFGTYPYTEFDIVPLALTGGGIGMEYPGIVGIAVSIYDNEPLLETTVAHETGHQWFYDAVGNDQVNQPWLDESMTQYITGLYNLDIHGQAGWDNSEAEWNNFWSRVGKTEIPIGRPVASYNGNTYGPIIYGRGPLFVAALADSIGAAAFNDCLQQYYLNFKWKVVTTQTYENWFQMRSGKNLDALFQKWVLQ